MNDNFKLIKGIVKGRPLDKYGRRRVWIPSYASSDGSSRYAEDYPLAQVSGSKELSESLEEGDVVFITFENGNYEFPVIIGKLSNGYADKLGDALTGYTTGGKLSTLAAEIVINNTGIEILTSY